LPARRPFPKWRAPVAHASANIGMIFGLVFLIAGLAFKVSAVPFQHVDAGRL